MNSNNIVLFPKTKISVPAQSLEELQDKIGKTRESEIDMIADESVNYLAYKYAEEGYDMFSEGSAPHIAMIVESIKSALLFSVGLPHPFQENAEEIFDFLQDDYDPESDEVNKEDIDNEIG